jgi:hypothetical protein
VKLFVLLYPLGSTDRDNGLLGTLPSYLYVNRSDVAEIFPAISFVLILR